MLTGLKAVSCSLKSELGPHPTHHHKPIYAEGHLFITVLAYQLVQVIRTPRRAAGENASWTTLRRILEGQQRITATFARADGRTVHVRKATRAEPPQQAIYDALGINPAPGGTRKTIVQQTPLHPLVVPLSRLGLRKWSILKDSFRRMLNLGQAVAGYLRHALRARRRGPGLRGHAPAA